MAIEGWRKGDAILIQRESEARIDGGVRPTRPGHETARQRATLMQRRINMGRRSTRVASDSYRHNIPAPGSKTPHEKYDGSGFAALSTSKLENVRIGHAFDDRGMAALASVASLRALDICHSKATDEGIAYFAKHPNLEEFSISSQGRPNRVTDKALSAIATISKLKRLNLHETFLTYEGGLKHLAQLKGQLLAISFKGSLVLPADVEKLRRDHPSLEVVTSTPTEILEAPNSRGVMKWASPAAVEYLKTGEKK